MLYIGDLQDRQEDPLYIQNVRTDYLNPSNTAKFLMMWMQNNSMTRQVLHMLEILESEYLFLGDHVLVHHAILSPSSCSRGSEYPFRTIHLSMGTS